ncbi:MAG: hypothetical protein SGJ04_08875 [Bacteroidota bacterium]|nr:hypothetical protein [Bacteroidota bacterium]
MANARLSLPDVRQSIIDQWKKLRTPKSTGAKSVRTFDLRQSVNNVFVSLTQSRKLFWTVYVLLALSTLFLAGVRGLYFSRMGVTGLQFVPEQPFLHEIIQYGQFIVGAVGYLFALPMDTIPGKGKAKEFLGDLLVAASFFFLFKVGSVAVYCYDIFSRGSAGISGTDQQLISRFLPDILRYGIPFLMVLALLRWLSSRKQSP